MQETFSDICSTAIAPFTLRLRLSEQKQGEGRIFVPFEYRSFVGSRTGELSIDLPPGESPPDWIRRAQESFRQRLTDLYGRVVMTTYAGGIAYRVEAIIGEWPQAETPLRKSNQKSPLMTR